MPERVTKRRAEAYCRQFGDWPAGYVPVILDTKFRKGRNHRMKVAAKFMTTKVVLNKRYGAFGLGPGHTDDSDVFPGSA